MPFALINVATLASWLTSDQPPRVLDARTRLTDSAAGQTLWREGHVPGAHHIDMDRDLATEPTPDGGRHPLPAPATFAATVRRFGITPTQRVVIYDDTGGRLAAARTWWMLRWAGHPAVHVLDGGWQAWQAAKQPVETEAPTPATPSHWQPDFNHDMIATADEAAGGKALLLDARAGERYRGEQEPMDPRAGHIPGARNLPGASLLDEQQLLLADAELQAQLPEQADIIAYCGSGVSACQLILAYAQAGRLLPRLYPGSWSAWSSDPTRPVATGPE